MAAIDEAALLTLFKQRRFPAEIILPRVRWSCKYCISCCNLAKMMPERDIAVDPSTSFRWVHATPPGREAGATKPGISFRLMASG